MEHQFINFNISEIGHLVSPQTAEPDQQRIKTAESDHKSYKKAESGHQRNKTAKSDH